jgi:hypothetical protein
MGTNWLHWLAGENSWLHKINGVLPQAAAILTALGLGKYAAVAAIIVDVIGQVEKWGGILGMDGPEKLDLAATVVAAKTSDTHDEAAATKDEAARAVQALIDEAKKALK